MSDLISREALLEAHQDLVAFGTDTTFAVRNLITNAPAIEQGEPVAWIDGEAIITKTYMHYGWVDSGRAIPDCWIPLYTAPPQPQTVKDALEEAARICDEHAKQLKEWKAQDYVIGMADTGAIICANTIRALIEKE